MQAAKALFVTQPALSRSIQSLEVELGGVLFDRVGRRIALTPFGREVLARAQRLVSDAESLKQTGHSLHAGQVGRLRIGLGSGPGAVLTVSMLRYMGEHHPHLQVEVARGSTDVLVDGLRAQRLDGVIVDIRAMRPSVELTVTHAFELSASFLARREHPLAVAGRPVSLDDVLAYPVASTPLSDEVARVLIERYGPRANPDDMVTLRCDETQSIVDLARQSDAIVLTIDAAGFDLVPLPVTPALDATARFGLVTLSRREPAPALRIVQEQLPKWVRALR